MQLLVAVVILLAYGETKAEVQECYICKPEGEPFLEEQFPNIQLPSCGLEPPVKKACPEHHTKGCLTQRRGSRIISKMCSGLDVYDCKEANDVTYCYCKGNMCNAEVIPTTTLTPETDDEDLSSEGSGDGVTQATTTTFLPEVKQVSTHSASESTVPSLLILIASILYTRL